MAQRLEQLSTMPGAVAMRATVESHPGIVNYHKFDLLSLRLFLAACELGSFKSAAEAVHLVPSAASRRIAEMESELGTRLFERHAVGVNPTEAGTLLRRHASLILTSYDNLYLECADLSAGIKGVVRVWGS